MAAWSTANRSDFAEPNEPLFMRNHLNIEIVKIFERKDRMVLTNPLHNMNKM